MTAHASFAALFTTCVVASVYVYTAFPSVAGGDSGELVAEACIEGGGVAHPPGYPLLILLFRGAIASGQLLLEDASPAWIVNRLCGLMGALTSGCIVITIEHCALLFKFQSHAYSLEAMTGAFLFAFSPLVWEYSVGAEVFALNNLIASILIMLTVLYAQTRRYHFIQWGALFCGLGLANQHTIVLFEGPLILWILFQGRQHIKLFQLAQLTCLFFLGLSPYIYTVYRGSTPSRGSWGDTSSVTGFITHLMREEYGSLKLSPKTADSEGCWHRLRVYGEEFTQEMLFIGLPLACLGILSSVRGAFSRTWSSNSLTMHKNKKKKIRQELKPPDVQMPWIGWALLSAQVCYVLIFNYLANIPLSDPLSRAVHSRFWMQSNIIGCIYIGMGLSTLRQWIFQIKTSPWINRLYSILLVSYILAQFSWRFPAMNQRHKGSMMRDYGLAILNGLPRGAILLSHTDINWNTIRYLQECEGQRQDIVHLSCQLMPYPWFTRQHVLYSPVTFPPMFPGVSSNVREPGNTRLILDFVRANIEQYPNIYLDLHSINDAEIQSTGLFHGASVVPAGMVWKIDAPQNVPTFQKWQRESDHVFQKYNTIMTLDYEDQFHSGSWEFVATKIYWDGIYQRGIYMLTHYLDSSRSVSPAQAIHGLNETSAQLHQVLHAVEKSKRLSFPIYDVMKNTALSYMQLNIKVILANHGSRETVYPADWSARIYAQGHAVITHFLEHYPDDRDLVPFQQFLAYSSNE